MESRETRRKGSSPRQGRSPVQSQAASSDAQQSLPSTASLVKATTVALVIAGILLVVAVLPVEFGIDPTGMGKALGLSSMKADSDGISGDDAQAPDGASATAETVAKTEVPLRSDTMTLVLQPGEGTEVKVEMLAGERFVFEWTTQGGPVNFDMHGEEPNAGDKFTSYWADVQKESARGAFVAPVSGTHGWFWRNRTEGPVSVTLNTSGFYERLFRAQ